MGRFARLGAVISAALSLATLGEVEWASAQTGPTQTPIEPATVEALRAAIKQHDYQTEFNILKSLADQGNARAQYNVGVMYADGQGVPRDYSESLRYFTLAANQSYPNAEYNLASAYEKGDGVARDHATAMSWCRKAADHGVAAAQFQLATAYMSGDGVTRDYAQAMTWLLKAADQGLVEAEFDTAIFYSEGPAGVPKDPVRAFMWADLAENGIDRVRGQDEILVGKIKRDRDLMRSDLTPAQIAEAKRLEDDWVTKHANASPALEPEADPN